MKIVKKQKTIEHPMEDIFDIDPGTTLVEYKEVLPSDIVQMPEYDDKDNEIEEKLEEIYTAAMGTYDAVNDELEKVEGKYKARVGEVTATMLTVALNAVQEKSRLKQHKDKISIAKRTPAAGSIINTTNNNLVVDRNQLMRMLEGKNSSGEGQ